MGLSKSDRFEEFLRRMDQAPSASSHDEAFKLLNDTLNQVEDELTDIPFQPDMWQTDGRMYPPQEDNARAVEDRGDVIRYRHKAHNTFIRDNGAIEIRDANEKLLFEKAGADGRKVDFQLPKNGW
jgi:hypothetical protein